MNWKVINISSNCNLSKAAFLLFEALALYVKLNYQEEVNNAETSLSDVDLLFRTELIGDVGKVSANQRKSNDESILSRELQTHL